MRYYFGDKEKQGDYKTNKEKQFPLSDLCYFAFYEGFEMVLKQVWNLGFDKSNPYRNLRCRGWIHPTRTE